ncbi:MAG: DUF4331 family protein [Gemmatimonadales bacterium]
MRLMTKLLALALALGLGACDDNPAGPGGGDDVLAHLAGRDFGQIDRFGLPAIATVFIPSAKKDAYNTAAPAGDRSAYSSDVQAVLTAFGHPNPAGLAAALLPDIQPFNTQTSSGFLNGRRPQDDVITAELGLIFGTNAALNDDHVDANDRTFLATFPYLAAPHQ